MPASACVCGGVVCTFADEPFEAGYCHCVGCRTLNAAPCVAVVCFSSEPEVHGATNSYLREDGARVHSCKICFATVYTKLTSDDNAKSIFHAPICTFGPSASGKNTSVHSSLPFEPQWHMNYSEGSTSFFDGLPKHSGKAPISQRLGQIITTNLICDAHHGRSKPTEWNRNCAVECSGHHDCLVRAYANGNKSNNPHSSWKDEPFMVKCPCGFVEFEILGSPDWTANCHCSICRRLHGGAPFVALSGYSMDSIAALHKDQLHKQTVQYKPTAREEHFACIKCKGWVLKKLNHLNCAAVFRSNIQVSSVSKSNSRKFKDDHGPEARFKPSCHIFYGSGAHNIYDDLTKFQGFPPLLGGQDRVTLANDIHNWKPFMIVWREARGTSVLACLSLVFLFSIPLASNFLNDEWERMPWRAWEMTFAEQHLKLPSFLICEYFMHALAVAALIHARTNASLDLFFASWICGTANDVFFMFMPKFCDNFWQAQATIMLTPRLPLYIVSMYVALIYYSHTASRRFGFSSPLAEAMMTGLLAAIFYTPYDLNGARFLWWTWHDTDAAIYERLGGAPIGSTMWILTYTCVFNLLYRWCLRMGGNNEFRSIVESAVKYLQTKFPESNSGIKSRTRCLTKLAEKMDKWQKQMRSGPTACVILFVCTSCTPLFMILLGQFSVFSLDIAGKPGLRTLILTLLVFISVVLFHGFFSENRQPRAEQRGYGDTIIGLLLMCYFVSHLWIMLKFDPQTHVSTGVHQAWSLNCNISTSYDIMGFEREDCLCGESPKGASKSDFTWGDSCASELPDTVAPNREALEWYTICGVANEPALGEMVLLVGLGLMFYGRAMLMR